MPPQLDTMIGNGICLYWHKFVHSGNKKSRKLNWWPREGLGRVSAGMQAPPFKA